MKPLFLLSIDAEPFKRDERFGEAQRGF